MTYKGINDVKLLILEGKNRINSIKITSEDDLIGVISENLNSVDWDLVLKGSRINVIEFNIITDNNSKSSNNLGEMFYNRIYQIYYEIIDKSDSKTWIV